MSSAPPYSLEFRREAVRLLRTSGRSIPQLARELGCSPQSLRNWARQLDVDEGKAARKAEHSIKTMCRVLGVSRSGYHAWHRRKPSARQREDARLTERIREIHRANRRVYGSPRIHAELRLADGVRVGRKRVERLMRQAGITYLRTWEGWLYLVAVQHVFSRRIVGWSMADHMRAELVTDALQMALAQRRPDPGLIWHSDQGSQFVSLAFGQQARAAGIAQSMGSRGDCFDIAMPSAWSPEEHEQGLAAFAVSSKRQRLKDVLSSPKGREKLRGQLNHFSDLDERFVIAVPANGRTDWVVSTLEAAGAPPQCYVLSAGDELDRRSLALADAIDAVFAQGVGTLVSCIPGQLAYFEGEHRGDRCILRRAER